MTKMKTEIGERAAIAVSVLDASLEAAHQLVDYLRARAEAAEAERDAALARAEAAEAEVERLRAARPDEPQELSEDGTTEAEELAFIGEEIRSLTPGRYLLTVHEEEGAFGIRDFSVLEYYAWAAHEAERQRIVDEADAMAAIGGEEVRDDYPKEDESEVGYSPLKR